MKIRIKQEYNKMAEANSNNKNGQNSSKFGLD